MALAATLPAHAEDGALVLSENESEDAEGVQLTAEPHDYDPNAPAFVPTEEWQTILPGQRVPAGLQYDIDLQTGVKRARLLPKEIRGGEYHE